MIVAAIVLAVAAWIASLVVWKSLRSGDAQPASFFLQWSGRDPISRSRRPGLFWFHLAPWLLLAPLCAILCVGAFYADFTYPTCDEVDRQPCVVR
jgi:hypothetical protein